MDQTILLMADILITAVILYVLITIRSKSPLDRRMDNKAEEEALALLRKGIDELGVKDKDLAEKQSILKDVIERLDDALADVQTNSAAEDGERLDYSAARSLLQRGEPVEKVIEMFNLTRGEADVLASINAMAS
jgi:hypothetical protein